MDKPTFTIDDLTDTYPPAIRSIVDRLRSIVFAVAPDASEEVNRGWRSINFRDAQLGYFCGLFPYEEYVDLFFEFGALLPDTDNILQGTARQIRYLRFQRPEEIDEDTVKHFLLAALDLPPDYSVRRGLIESLPSTEQDGPAK